MKIGLISDFNAANLVRLIEKHGIDLSAAATLAPFGEVVQTILEPASEFWRQSYDAVVVWTLPGSVLPSFNAVLGSRQWSGDTLNQEVDAFIDAVNSLRTRTQSVFIPTWLVPSAMSHRPSIEMKDGLGSAAAVLRINVRLLDRLASCPGIILFNAERWLRHGGPNSFNDRLWFLSKTPFSNAVFEDAARDVVATLRGLKGLQKKAIILDLDNTLWGGTVGDVGPEGIQIGGHDPIGEAYLQFQKELKRLSREGIVLALVSKNDEALALEAIETNPEMALRSSDFVGWRINWDDKAQNIIELMADLNLGLDSAVFIDDSPHERSRIREALPDVFVPEWPSDPMDYAKALRDLRCFECPSLIAEDRIRTAMYVSDRERKKLQVEIDSVDKWLQLLGLEVSVAELSPANLERTAQLLNKTNQMNLTTRRLSTQGLAAWASDKNHRIWTFRVKDKIGDYGLCGVASLAFVGSRASLVDFVLSCRAMGRGIEEAIISVIARKVREAGIGELTASYVATKKNQPCLRWIERQSWFARQSDSQTFLLDVSRDIPTPSHIRVTFP